MMDAGLITVDHFGEVDIRIGTVKSAKINKSARKAAYVLQVDCGPLGIKATSAQITESGYPLHATGFWIYPPIGGNRSN